MARELCKQVAIVERRPHILSTSCWRNCQGVDRLRGHGLAFFRRGETLKDDFVRARGLRRGGRFASKGRVLPPNWLSNFVTPMADGRATCPCVKVDLLGPCVSADANQQASGSRLAYKRMHGAISKGISVVEHG